MTDGGSENGVGSSANPDFDRAMQDAARDMADGGRTARQQADEARANATRQLNETAELLRRRARERHQSAESTRVYDDIARQLERSALSLNHDFASAPVPAASSAPAPIHPLWIGGLAVVFAVLLGAWLRRQTR